MKIGVLSDIHGNIDALNAVLSFYDDAGVDHLVCLGDVVGYGPDPDTCVSIVRERVRHTVIGNHDAAVSGKMDYAYYYDTARTALDYHAALVSPDNKAWLLSRPFILHDDDRCYSHGSPVSPESFDYVFNLSQARSLLPHWDELAPVTFIGHSHLTKSYALAGGIGRSPSVRDLESDSIVFSDSFKYICTVGSVGQPRDNDARACCTVYDTDERRLTWHRLDYNIGNTARLIFDCPKLSPDFGKRLFLGI